MSSTVPTFAVIVPVGPGDQNWLHLIEDLRALPEGTELCFSATAREPINFGDLIEGLSHLRVSWRISPPGRARQLNSGVNQTSAAWLWFIHGDSRLSQQAVGKVCGWLKEEHTRDLGYLDLEFTSDGPVWMKITAWGTWFRSRALGLPFGDQGLCLSRSFFLSLGGFNEKTLYGEDHLLIWRVRRAGGRVTWIGGKILTSARKYAKHGWLRTTALHLSLTVRQAIPQAYGLAKERLLR